MYTEEEARAKWCPKAILVLDSANYAAGNRHSGIHHDCLCIASDCMAWRWGRKRRTAQEDGEACSFCDGSGAFGSATCHQCEGTGRAPILQAQGYCGAFGKPESV